MTKYNKEVVMALKRSEREKYNLNHPCVSVEHFILSTLSFDNNIKNFLNSKNITYEVYKDELLKLKNTNVSNNIVFYSTSFKKIIDMANDNAMEFSSEEICLEHIFISLIEDNNNTGLDILKKLKLNIDLFYKDLIKHIKNNQNLLVLEIGANLNELSKNNKLDKVVGRKKEINQVIEILARKNKNNPILIGEAGVGKTAIIEELANMINKNSVPDFLKNKTIISINIAHVIGGTKYRGEFEEKLSKILRECEEYSDLIIFIDEVHTLVGAGGAEGAIDASNILKPILARGNIRIIGATTTSEYKKYIASDKAFDRRFQKVYIEEPSTKETLNILKEIKRDYEKYHNVKINDSLLNDIIYYSNKYIFDRKEPDKSIDVLDEVCASTSISQLNDKDFKYLNELNKVVLKKEEAIKNEDYLMAKVLKEKEQNLNKKIKLEKNKVKEVNIETLKKVIESKCNSKIYDKNSNEIFDNLEETLNKIVLGQNKSIKELVAFLKISYPNNLPLSILINGPTGVGKTHSIKQLAKIINLNLIRLDMSDFSYDISVNKILGAPQGFVGYNDNNTVFEQLSIKPNSIILLDEIDKAHPSVINLLLNILEDGILKTSKGDYLNFKNCIIFMTTNNLNKKSIGYLDSNRKKDSLEEIFSKEFINRINYILNYKTLTKEDIKDIIKQNLKTINKEYNKKIKLNETIITNIISESLFKDFGARNINSIIKKQLEKQLITSNTL